MRRNFQPFTGLAGSNARTRGKVTHCKAHFATLHQGFVVECTHFATLHREWRVSARICNPSQGLETCNPSQGLAWSNANAKVAIFYAY